MGRSNAYGAFKKYLIEVLKLDPKAAGSYVSMARGFAKKAGKKLESLTLAELIKTIKAFVCRRVEKRSDYSRRTALRAYLKFAKYLEKKSAAYLPKRSTEGYVKFAGGTYIKKRGKGKLMSVDQYLSYLRSFCRIYRIGLEQLHRLTKNQLIGLIRDLDGMKPNNKNIGHIKSAAGTYLDYVRMTLGQYPSE